MGICLFLFSHIHSTCPDLSVSLGIIIRPKCADEFMKALEERLNISGTECHKFLAFRR